MRPVGWPTALVTASWGARGSSMLSMTRSRTDSSRVLTDDTSWACDMECLVVGGRRTCVGESCHNEVVLALSDTLTPLSSNVVGWIACVSDHTGRAAMLSLVGRCRPVPR